MTILDLLTCFFLSAIPAAFNYFLDYCLGHPMSDDKVSIKAILFRYSYWLAKRAMPMKKYQGLVAHYAKLLNNEDPEVRMQGREQLKTAVMYEGRKYFFYEQAIGMCPFCTNFWCSMIAALIFFFTIPLHVFNPIVFFLFTPIFSHTILRKL